MISRALPFVFVFVACGSQTAEQDAPPNATLSDAATNDAASALDAANASDASTASDASSFACGTVTCGPTQLCVHPCCGGAGGQDACTPPPSFCIDDAKDPRAVGCQQEGGARELACICG